MSFAEFASLSTSSDIFNGETIPMVFFPKSSNLSRRFRETDLHDNRVVKFLVGLATVIVITLLFPRGESLEFESETGTLWAEHDLVAPFAFPIHKDSREYEKEKREAVGGVMPVFERHAEFATAQRESLSSIILRARVAAAIRQRWQRISSPTDSIRFIELSHLIPVSLTERQWMLTLQLGGSDGNATNWLHQTLAGEMDEILKRGIIDNSAARGTHTNIAMRRGAEETVLPASDLFDIESALATIEQNLMKQTGANDSMSLALAFARATLRPTIFFNQIETEKLVRIAIENVPRTLGFVQQNERIIGKNERITLEIKQKLESLRKAQAYQGAAHGQLLQLTGVFFHVILIVALYAIYLYLFRKRIFHSNTRLALIAIVILLQTLFAYLTLVIDVKAPLQYLIFVPAASMLLTIIFDSRVAFYGTVTVAFLVAGIRGNDYSVALTSLVAGALAVYTVRDIKHRTQIFRSIIFIFVGYALVILALGLERFTTASTIAGEMTLALINAVFSPVITYALLIFFERSFRVTTDLTLLELSDLNHPLLKRLSEEAPGTFHHSITLGTMAEAAAEEIGANAILARVGAYYHDIGKVEKAEYFSENQQRGRSRHGRLSPRMSARIIASHVKEGLDIGRRHLLPPELLAFIPQHHGTTRISFFYDKALKQAAAKSAPLSAVHEEDYRYPGPKPQTKEAGILMLADTVEASARSFENPTHERLESLIDTMMKSRFIDGQLDECELTLRDISKIKEAFLKILVGIHHGRIEYPQSETSIAQTAEQTSELPLPSTPEEPTTPEHSHSDSRFDNEQRTP